MTANGNHWGKSWRWLRGWLGHMLNGAAEPDSVRMYLRLAVQLELDHPPGERAKSILLTSPSSEDLIRDAGRELAYALAEEMGRRTLIIELDFSNPRAAGAPGVTDLLVHGLDGLPAAVRPTAHGRVFTLPAGTRALTAASFAGGHHGELIARACRTYDCVILLGAPALRDPKWLVFAPLVDHSLLMASKATPMVRDLEAACACSRNPRPPGWVCSSPMTGGPPPGSARPSGRRPSTNPEELSAGGHAADAPARQGSGRPGRADHDPGRRATVASILLFTGSTSSSWP